LSSGTIAFTGQISAQIVHPEGQEFILHGELANTGRSALVGTATSIIRDTNWSLTSNPFLPMKPIPAMLPIMT